MMDRRLHPHVTAIVLAAGLSTRMGGHPKPLLPFGDRTVLERILMVLTQCPVDHVVVITGHCHDAVESYLEGSFVQTAFNPDYASGEMLSSVQAGLRAAPAESDAALIVLGDQPALASAVVEQVIGAYQEGWGSIVIPSFQMRRGHPLIIGRQHWQAILELRPGQTLRDHMVRARAEIHHVEVHTPAILRDMDTPEEYRRQLAEYLHRHPAEQAQAA